MVARRCAALMIPAIGVSINNVAGKIDEVKGMTISMK